MDVFIFVLYHFNKTLHTQFFNSVLLRGDGALTEDLYKRFIYILYLS